MRLVMVNGYEFIQMNNTLKMEDMHVGNIKKNVVIYVKMSRRHQYELQKVLL
jgi:hypothetical protein